MVMELIDHFAGQANLFGPLAYQPFLCTILQH
jgi:hypothetical protein